MPSGARRLRTAEQYERVHAAKRGTDICALCGRAIGDRETVYIERFAFGTTYAAAPVGIECASPAFLERVQELEPAPCAGCDRRVFYAMPNPNRRRSACSRRCLGREQAATRSPREADSPTAVRRDEDERADRGTLGTRRLMSDEERERFHQARRSGEVCAACWRPINDAESVYIERFLVGPVGGRPVATWALVGVECASAEMLQQVAGEPPERCAGCGRGVCYRSAYPRRQRALCSRRCAMRVKNAARATAGKESTG